jgi:chromate transport protein ChrA
MTYTLPSNFTGLYSVGNYVNSVTDGLFWTIIMISVYAVLFFSMKGYGTERAIGYSSFIGAILSILLFTIGFVPASVLVFSILFAGFGIWSLKTSNSREY